MALDATVKARVNKQLKEEVTEILSELGLTTSQAIQLFLKRVQIEQGLPFDMKLPKKEPPSKKADKKMQNIPIEIIYENEE